MVIAIIALLIGILLPALGKARVSARKLVSLSNMRQLGTAVSLYANDEDDWLPSPGYTSSNAKPVSSWLFDTFHPRFLSANKTRPYRNLSDALRDELWQKHATGLLWQYLGGEENVFVEGFTEYFRSPADRGPFNTANISPVEELTSYVANGALQGLVDPPDSITNSGRWPSRYRSSDMLFSNAIYFWEGAWPEDGVRNRVWVVPTGWGGEAGVQWYGEWGSNTARIDGSGSWVTGKGQEASLNPTNPAQVFRDELKGTGQLGEWHREAVQNTDHIRNPLYPDPNVGKFPQKAWTN